GQDRPARARDRVGRPLRLGQRAALGVQVDLAADPDARDHGVGLLGVVDALADGHLAVLVDLARVVVRALLAALVTGVVDGDHLAGGVVDHRRAGRTADGLALRGVADRVLPGPPALLELVDEA